MRHCAASCRDSLARSRSGQGHQVIDRRVAPPSQVERPAAGSPACARPSTHDPPSGSPLAPTIAISGIGSAKLCDSTSREPAITATADACQSLRSRTHSTSAVAGHSQLWSDQAEGLTLGSCRCSEHRAAAPSTQLSSAARSREVLVDHFVASGCSSRSLLIAANSREWLWSRNAGTSPSCSGTMRRIGGATSASARSSSRRRLMISSAFPTICNYTRN